MTFKTLLLSAAAAAALLGFGGAPAWAQDDNCIVVVGDESSGEKQSADPADMWSGDDALHVWPHYNRLMNVDSSFNLEPELAESWEVSADGKTWTFNLRPGVTFHDGKPLVAADVVYSFRRLLDPATNSGAASLMSFLTPDGITAVDDATVQMTTADPVVELPQLITNKFTHIVQDGATTDALKAGKSPGTGPFMIEQFTPGEPVRILRRYDGYWRGAAASPCIKEIVIQEPATAMAAIKSGEADVLLSVSPAIIPTLKDDPSVGLQATAASTSYVITMWTDTPPFTDARVRQAFKLVVDRQALVDNVFLGFAEAGNDNPVPLGSSVAFETTPRARDVEKAKQLLADAGFPGGIKVDLYASEVIAGMMNMVQAYAQMAADAGITVNIVSVPAESYWDDTWLKQPFGVSGWTMRSPAEGLAIAYTKDAKWNETHFYNDEFDATLKAAAVELDETKRGDLYKKAQQMLADEGGTILPIFIHRVAALRSACTGYTPHVQNQNLNFEKLACTD